jgi:hypothetical protein
VQHADEVLRPAYELCISMLHEAKSMMSRSGMAYHAAGTGNGEIERQARFMTNVSIFKWEEAEAKIVAALRLMPNLVAAALVTNDPTTLRREAGQDLHPLGDDARRRRVQMVRCARLAKGRAFIRRKSAAS